MASEPDRVGVELDRDPTVPPDTAALASHVCALSERRPGGRVQRRTRYRCRTPDLQGCHRLAQISLQRSRIAANAILPVISLALRDPGQRLAGTPDRPDGQLVPNITPDPDTGIGKWEKEDVIQLLRTGTTPEQSKVKGAMRETIDDGLGLQSSARPDTPCGPV